MSEYKENDMEKKKEKRKLRLSVVIILLVVTNVITAAAFSFISIPLTGGRRVINGQEKVVNADQYNFLQQFSKMMTIKDDIEANYVDKLDENKMVEGAINGMVNSIGDPYTVYLDQRQYSDLMTQTTGSYAGIGTYVGDQDGKIVIIAPIEGSPAEKAGLQSGDVIVKIDGKSVSASDMNSAVSLMLGAPGTKVTLTINRPGKGNMDFTITRATITLKTVSGKMLESKIGYIQITQFDENTGNDFNKTLDNLLSQGMKGLIIDLRNNPGGLLTSSTQIADRLLGKGTIVYTIDKNGNKDVITSDAKELGLPIAVLVNGGTASASEILSGAIKDFKAGTLIGTKTFGKGLVQTIIDLKDGTGLKVTIARYYTPSGVCIQKIGINPDIVVNLPAADQNKVLTPQEDIQLQKAIQVIKSKL